MKVLTKYSVDETVWFMENSKPVSNKIWEIDVSVNKARIKIIYCFFKGAGIGNTHSYKNEPEVFPTKEALLQSL